MTSTQQAARANALQFVRSERAAYRQTIEQRLTRPSRISAMVHIAILLGVGVVVPIAASAWL